LCLVALEGEEVVGHIVFSRARLASGHEVLALAPMAVVPERQRAGIGSRLIRDALTKAQATGFPLVVVLGHPEYYPRFGFEPASAHGIEAPWDVPPPAWMALPLPTHDPTARGMVTYARAFETVT
jgi:putative acetyltransferase